MTKRFFVSILIGVLSFVCIEQGFAQPSNHIKAYIDQYKLLALEQERLYGIPAPITLAQGIIESEAGRSELAVNAKNHFGIKALGKWKDGVYYAWDDEDTKSKFRVYSSVEASYEDHSQIIKNGSRYQSLFSYSVFDYRNWAYGLQKAGYATNSDYAKALIGYIDAYQLYTINGGVKLKPGIKRVIKKTVTVEELIEEEEVLGDSEASEEEEEVLNICQKVVVSINEVRCTIIYPGETLSSIATKYDIPKHRLLEYNEAPNERSFHEGDIVYLEKKKKRYGGVQDYYRVQAGETLLSIAQQFGIRTKSLAKMNKIDPSSPLREGERLRLK